MISVCWVCNTAIATHQYHYNNKMISRNNTAHILFDSFSLSVDFIHGLCVCVCVSNIYISFKLLRVIRTYSMSVALTQQ